MAEHSTGASQPHEDTEDMEQLDDEHLYTPFPRKISTGGNFLEIADYQQKRIKQNNKIARKHKPSSTNENILFFFASKGKGMLACLVQHLSFHRVRIILLN